MGEAKRRQQAPLPIATEYRTGRQIKTRRGGSLFAFLKNDNRYVQTAKDGALAKAVPCADCTACCYHPRVDVDPTVERPEDLKYLDLVPDPKDESGFILRKRDDGACVHLGPNGCTVYHHRPRACRTYDCRRFSVTGVIDTYDNDKTQPGWIFDIKTKAERCFHLAVGMSVARHLSRNKSITATEALRVAMEGVKEFLPIARQMVNWLDSIPRAEAEAFLANLTSDAKALPKESDASEDLVSLAAE